MKNWELNIIKQLTINMSGSDCISYKRSVAHKSNVTKNIQREYKDNTKTKRACLDSIIIRLIHLKCSKYQQYLYKVFNATLAHKSNVHKAGNVLNYSVDTE